MNRRSISVWYSASSKYAETGSWVSDGTRFSAVLRLDIIPTPKNGESSEQPNHRKIDMGKNAIGGRHGRRAGQHAAGPAFGGKRAIVPQGH
uniref:Uncharacterized protein n=1 Tax=Ralstonia solanacearum TaxID=305 RepID=A0A0S4VIG2_RALSL|nr:protein of unknown function [Ralstonia solanacearum]CUV39428.1 protein of unknown function [Ralstonia solanacearum]CUV53988.1 protein of unknown function [Ralstonia solanacearum]